MMTIAALIATLASTGQLTHCWLTRPLLPPPPHPPPRPLPAQLHLSILILIRVKICGQPSLLFLTSHRAFVFHLLSVVTWCCNGRIQICRIRGRECGDGDNQEDTFSSH